MSTPQSPSSRPQATRLLEILESALAVQREILAAIKSRRDAVRRADFAALARIERTEGTLALRMSELERNRVAETMQVAARLGLQGTPGLREISERLGEPERARLDLLRSELRTVLEHVQREGSIVRQASERLSAHMAGILQSVHSALAHAKVYSRAGVVAIGPNIVSSLDIKS